MLLLNISHWYSLTHAHTHMQLICTLSDKRKNILASIHPSLRLKHDFCVANGGVQISKKKVWSNAHIPDELQACLKELHLP